MRLTCQGRDRRKPGYVTGSDLQVALDDVDLDVLAVERDRDLIADRRDMAELQFGPELAREHADAVRADVGAGIDFPAVPLEAAVIRPCWSTVIVATVNTPGVTLVSASWAGPTAFDAILPAVTPLSASFAVVTPLSASWVAPTAPAAILAAVTGAAAIFAAITPLSASWVGPTAPPAILAIVTALPAIFVAMTALSTSWVEPTAAAAILVVVTAPSAIFGLVTAPSASRSRTRLGAPAWRC